VQSNLRRITASGAEYVRFARAQRQDQSIIFYQPERASGMEDEKKAPEISYQIRVKPGRAGTDPNAPDWEVCELEDGVVKNNADIYDNMTEAEAHQIAGMWRKKKEEAEATVTDSVN
jgi:hypothetical protein